MASRKLGKNEPCPCGSGRKYKACCFRKGFEWRVNENGEVVRKVPLTPDVADALKQQVDALREKLGREPGPDDLVFPDVPHLEVLEHQTVEAMKLAGIDPAMIYAFQKTGLLVSTENQHLIPDKDLAEWDSAIKEYKRRMAAGESDPIP